MTYRLCIQSTITVDLPDDLTSDEAVAAALAITPEWSGWPDGAAVHVGVPYVTRMRYDRSNGAGIERAARPLDEPGAEVAS